jgi:hypothetical protein
MCKQQHFDVVFTYNPQDEFLVLNVADQLRKFGLYPWLEADMRPGTMILDVIQKAIESINCSAIFFGSETLQEYQVRKLNLHISQVIKKGKILIPVLLPGVDKIPDTMLFTKEIRSVRFAHGIDDRKAIEDLVWAITCQKPEKSTEQETEQKFDVLLCYNQEDQFTVKNIANQLKENQIQPWLDIWEVPGGVDSYEQLEKDIERIRSVAFLIGSNGCPWQKEPLRSVIGEFFQRDVRLIPVILKNVQPEPKLPVYLKRKTSVDFRDEESDPLEKLVWSIRKLKE